MAPDEGNSPVKLLSDKSNEAKCFPVLFPIGGPTFHDEREKKSHCHDIKMHESSTQMDVLHRADFFYAQYMSELDQIVSNVSIALLKGSDKRLLKGVTSDMLTNPESLAKILNYDEGYKF